MAELPRRTKKDEDEYIKHLQREEPIKTEVIVELRGHNKLLLENQKRLLEALIASEETIIKDKQALLVYRRQLLDATKHMISNDGSSCVPGCKKHVWDSADGWKKRDSSTDLFLAE